MKEGLLQYRSKGFTLCSIVIAIAVAGCSDTDSALTQEPTTPDHPVCRFAQVEVDETIFSDGGPVNSTQTFRFEDGRLSNHHTRQSMDFNGETVCYEHTSAVEYQERQAVVTDEFGNISTYSLNDNGYAVHCVRQEPNGNRRTYDFTYRTSDEGKHFLTGITETLEERPRPYSTILIDYDHDNPSHISQRIENTTATFQLASEKEIANISEIPQHFFYELYPLSLHATAIYGKLLGEPFPFLVTDFTPENSPYNETCNYRYDIDKLGYVSSCREVRKCAGETFLRILQYKFSE